MKHRTNQYALKILLGLFVLIMVGCPNNLVDKIEEEVAIVVTPPSIVSIYPESGAVSIPVDMDDILITFTKEIDSSSVNNSTFVTKDSDGSAVIGTYSVSNNTIAFNPSSNLAYITEFTITAKSAILDIDGNPMSKEFSWNFTTEDAPAGIKPIVQSFDIEGGNSSTNISNVDLGIFATDYNGGTSDLKFHYRLEGALDWSNWIDLTEGLGTTGIILNITLGFTETFTFESEVMDAVGILSPINSTQIIYETAAPSPIDVNWDDESVFPYNGSSLKITFDEEMAPGSFLETDFTLVKSSDLSPVTGMLSLNNEGSESNIVAELWGLSLEPNVEYKVTLQPNVTDIAGNQVGGVERIWYFSTGDSTDTSPPDGLVTLTDRGLGAVFVTLPAGSIATDDFQLKLDFSDISDDYNSVSGMKIWGDNDGSGTDELFEENASMEVFATTRDWNVSPTPGTKFILYKFVDTAGNESSIPGQIKIILDNAIPDTPVVIINSGDSYTNASDRKVDLVLSSNDIHSGVKEMMLSNSSLFTGGIWQDWAPTVSSWELQDIEGLRTVYFKVRDFLDQESLPDSSFIVLDRVAPLIEFNTNHILVNDEIQLIRDPAVTGSDVYQITDSNFVNSIYNWEQISGPGSLYFNSIPGRGTGNDGNDISDPWVWASTEGSYFIQQTFTDSAGNTSSEVVPFSWDETAPSEILNLTVTQSNPGYSTSNQPTWSWETVADADFYRTSFVSDFSSYEETTLPSYSPNTALSEGVHTLYVKAYDNAGNSSADNFQSITVDTIDPVINITTYQYVANFDNQTITIDFSGSDGTITDTGGSGIDSNLWAQTMGPGIVTFGSSALVTTTVSANTDGDYQLSFTVSDAAGNTSIAYFPLLRDITLPGTPAVTGPDVTPSQYPTWYWTTGGGGLGIYQYQLDSGGWSSELIDTSFTGTLLTDFTNHILEVKEKDSAGNWSVVGSKNIYVDTLATTPPPITIADGEPLLRTIDSITWDVYTGAGGAASNWRYQLDSTAGTWTEMGSGLPEPPTAAETVFINNLTEGDHTLYVQEWVDEWEAEIGSHTITVDTIDPNDPVLSGTGNTTLDTGRTATNDTTPTWSWSSGGGGNGQFEYQFNGGSIVATTNTSFTPSSQIDDTYSLNVRERDQAGNWSALVTHSITVDTVAPIISTVLVRGPTHPDDIDYTYTNNTIVSVDITGNISSESEPVTIQYWDGAWIDWSTYFTGSSQTITNTLTTSNGTKTVYIQLMDEAGNISGYISDTIILDNVDPSATFSINAGASTTPSLSFYLTLSATDNYSSAADIEVSTYDSGSWNTYRPYSPSMLSDFQFSNAAGGKGVYVMFRDAAGNTTGSLYDSITFQVPVPTYALKGYYGTGATSVYYTPVTEPAGTYATRYYTYYTTDPGADPNSGDPVTYLGYTTSTSYDYVSGIPTEELLYFFTRAYNSDTGGWGPYSANSVMGFSSNLTIIYDSSDGVDVTLAEYIKTVLQSNLPSSYPTSITGTMPTWTVTLLPEDLVSSTYSTSNIIYGDPVILTPSTAELYVTANKVRNIVAGNHGIVAMSYNGLRFIDVASDNWTAWGYPSTAGTDADQQPYQIGYGNSYTISYDKYYMYTWGYSNSVWSSPLDSTSFPSSDEGQVQIGYSTGLLAERALYRPAKDNPIRGFLYGRSQDYVDRFPVVRQGRFLYYGYDGMWTRPYSGWVYFINLISRMTTY